jgi:hypothetical protein
LNIDFIEAIELVASMLLEVPFTLMEGGKITSRSFKKLAYNYEKSVKYLSNLAFHCRTIELSRSCVRSKQRIKIRKHERML